MSRLEKKRVWADSDLFFSPAMELELVAHIKRMESRLFGFILSQLKRVAHDYAEGIGIQHNSTAGLAKLERTGVMTLRLATVTRFL